MTPPALLAPNLRRGLGCQDGGDGDDSSEQQSIGTSCVCACIVCSISCTHSHSFPQTSNSQHQPRETRSEPAYLCRKGGPWAWACGQQQHSSPLERESTWPPSKSFVSRTLAHTYSSRCRPVILLSTWSTYLSRPSFPFIVVVAAVIVTLLRR